MTARALSLVASLAWGCSDFASGTAARAHALGAVLVRTRAGAVLLLGAVALLTSARGVGDALPYVVATSAVTPLASLALMRALAVGPMGVTAPIIATSASVPALWGGLSGHAPGGLAISGIVAAGVGVVLASRSRDPNGVVMRREGIVAAALAAVLIGTSMLLLHAAAARSAVTAVLLERSIELVGVAAVLAVARRARGPRAARPTGKDSASLLAVGAIESVAITSYAAASNHGSLTVAAVLSSLYPVVTVLLARAVHGERLTPQQVLGATLTLVGVALVVAAGGA
jgi:drug/metabolite transporter (DMT)-like permease